MSIDTPARTLVKTISWRLVSIVITFSVTFAITRNVAIAVSISFIDNLIKLFIYYFHERYWTHIRWGKVKYYSRK